MLDQNPFQEERLQGPGSEERRVSSSVSHLLHITYAALAGDEFRGGSRLLRGSVKFSVEDMFPIERNYASLRSLSFCVHGKDSKLDFAFTARLFPDYLRNFPQAESLTLSPSRLYIDTPGVAELAKLREITLDECVMDVLEVQDLFLAIFKQDVVNIERITVIAKGSSIACRIRTFGRVS